MPLLAIPDASPFLTGSFIAMAVALAALLVAAVDAAGRRLDDSRARRRRWTLATAVAAMAWMAGTWAVAETGHLSRLDLRPPPFLLLPPAILVLALVMAFTPFGRRLVDGLPLSWLIAAQAFRFPLELLMHRAYREGVMPLQMSFSGWNFDILTGITALPLAWALSTGRAGRGAVIAWNVMGALLLANVVAIAVVSTPMLAWFGPTLLNTWVMVPPFVWLPAVMVLMAAAGHLLVARALWRRAP